MFEMLFIRDLIKANFFLNKKPKQNSRSCDKVDIIVPINFIIPKQM